MTMAGHTTHQPIAVLEIGLVNQLLGLTELDATGPKSQRHMQHRLSITELV